MAGVAIIDVRILDTFEGAEFVRHLEGNPKVSLVFAVENPSDKTADTLETHGAVISNAGKLNARDFWRGVFEFVDNNHNQVVAIGAHYRYWQLVNEANNNAVPFQFVYNVDNQRMVWL